MTRMMSTMKKTMLTTTTMTTIIRLELEDFTVTIVVLDIMTTTM